MTKTQENHDYEHHEYWTLSVGLILLMNEFTNRKKVETDKNNLEVDFFKFWSLDAWNGKIAQQI